jgi:threonine dehydratase
VLAGAGTVGLEILEDAPDVDAVIVPVGGGGLLGGVASAIKVIAPRVRVVAVELAAGPGLLPALAAGRPVPVPRPNTLADGMPPPFVGTLPLAIAREAVDDAVTVTEAEIVEAMLLLMPRRDRRRDAGLFIAAHIAAPRSAPPPGARHRPWSAPPPGACRRLERAAAWSAPQALERATGPGALSSSIWFEISIKAYIAYSSVTS